MLPYLHPMPQPLPRDSIDRWTGNVPDRELKNWPNARSSRFVHAGGVRWHVQQSGSGPTLLLVHGTAASTHSWRDVMPILARHFTVLAMDLPGHGLSSQAAASQMTIQGLSNLMTVLLQECRFRPQFVVGHSAGAVVLCNMCLTRQIDPALVLSLNGAFLPLVGTASLLFAPLAKLLAASRVLAWLLSKRAAHRDNVARVIAGTGSVLDQKGVDLYLRLVQDPGHLAAALTMMSRWDLASFQSQLRLLRTPLALLVADNDRAVPLQQAMQVMEFVPRTTLYPLPGMGHLAHEEQPAYVAERIRAICHETRAA